MGSSIIFLLVIAIWAVFLLPDLQTRRHQLAQSRSASRVLGASRVLRRAGGPEVSGASVDAATTPRPSLTTRRESAAPVVVKPREELTESIDMTGILRSHSTDHVIAARSHAVTASTTGSTSIASLDEAYVDDALAHPHQADEDDSSLAEPESRPEDEPDVVLAPAATAKNDAPQDGAESRKRATSKEPELPRRAASVKEAVEPRDADIPREVAEPSRAATLTLAAMLMVGLVALPVTLVLGLLSVLPWVCVLVALFLVGGSVAGLRVFARRRRAAQRARRASARAPRHAEGVTAQPAARTAVGERTPTPAPRHAEVSAPAPVETATVVAPSDVEVATVDRSPSPAPADDFFDQAVTLEDDDSESDVPEQFHGPTAPPRNPRPLIDDRPRQWSPRDVPRPTYLMKPRAPEGRLTAPDIGFAAAAQADPFDDLLDGDDDLDLTLPRPHAV